MDSITHILLGGLIVQTNSRSVSIASQSQLAHWLPRFPTSTYPATISLGQFSKP